MLCTILKIGYIYRAFNWRSFITTLKLMTALSAIRNIPQATRNYVLLLLLLGTLGSLPRVGEMLIVRVDSLSQKPWTFLTASYYENNLVSTITVSTLVFFGGKYFEHAWGGMPFLLSFRR